MLAARLAHFSVSSRTTCQKPADEPPTGTPPGWASRALILASASAALISRLSLSAQAAVRRHPHMATMHRTI
jgi:hypothetical protein